MTRQVDLLGLGGAPHHRLSSVMPKRPPESRAGPAPIPLVARLELPATTNLFFLGREPPRHDEGAPNGNGNEAVHDGRPAPLVDIISSEEGEGGQGPFMPLGTPCPTLCIPRLSLVVAPTSHHGRPLNFPAHLQPNDVFTRASARSAPCQ